MKFRCSSEEAATARSFLLADPAPSELRALLPPVAGKQVKESVDKGLDNKIQVLVKGPLFGLLFSAAHMLPLVLMMILLLQHHRYAVVLVQCPRYQ